jgi:hypothetical protein
MPVTLRIEFQRDYHKQVEVIDLPAGLEKYNSYTLALMIQGALVRAAKEEQVPSVDESPFKDIKFTPLPVADNPLWKKR